MQVSRRAFLSAVAAASLSASVRASVTRRRAPAVDAARLRRRVEQLSTFGRPPQGTFVSGVSRVAYSDADISARAWLLAEMRGAGLEPRIDAAGNIFARLRRDASRRCRRSSSARTSIRCPSGGNFDGDLGSLAALEVSRPARPRGVTHPPSARDGASGRTRRARRSAAAPRAAASSPATCRPAISTRCGTACAARDAIRSIGGDPARIEEARAAEGRVARLSRAAHRAGRHARSRPACRSASSRASSPSTATTSTSTGFANHAGTTPMAERQDALRRRIAAGAGRARDRDGAARAARSARSGNSRSTPNSPNVDSRPGRAQRRVSRPVGGDADALGEEIRARARPIAARPRTDDQRSTLASSNPPALARRRRAGARSNAPPSALGLAARRLPSGAGHDAQMMAGSARWG